MALVLPFLCQFCLVFVLPLLCLVFVFVLVFVFSFSSLLLSCPCLVLSCLVCSLRRLGGRRVGSFLVVLGVLGVIFGRLGGRFGPLGALLGCLGALLGAIDGPKDTQPNKSQNYGRPSVGF